VFGREPRFLLNSRDEAAEGTHDLHLEVQRLIDNVRAAEEVVGESLRKRAHTIERCNKNVKYALSVSVGNYV